MRPGEVWKTLCIQKPLCPSGLQPWELFPLFCFVVFSFSGRCLYGNVIFSSLKTYFSGVNSFEVTIFCVMLSGHLDSKSSVKHHRKENSAGSACSLSTQEITTANVAVLCSWKLPSNLILSQIQKHLKKANESGFLGHHDDGYLFPQYWQRGKLQIHRILQVWDTAVGHDRPVLRFPLLSLPCRWDRTWELATCCLLWLKPEAPPGFRATSGNMLDAFLGALNGYFQFPRAWTATNLWNCCLGLHSGILWTLHMHNVGINRMVPPRNGGEVPKAAVFLSYLLPTPAAWEWPTKKKKGPPYWIVGKHSAFIIAKLDLYALESHAFLNETQAQPLLDLNGEDHTDEPSIRE